MALDTLKNLYLKELHDLYSAEKQLVRALPRMARAAQSPELKGAFKSHLDQTKEHVRRLEQVLAQAGEQPNGARCKAMAALIREGNDLLKEGGDPAVLDAGLITAAQKIEHYEISGYGSVRTYANMLRFDEAAELLQQTLNEEGAADETLTELAEATLSAANAPGRLADIGMQADVEPGGTDMRSYDAALQEEALAATGSARTATGDPSGEDATGTLPNSGERGVAGGWTPGRDAE